MKNNRYIFQRVALALLVIVLASRNVNGMVASKLAPTEPDTTQANGAQILSGANLAFSGKLDLITTTVFTGGISLVWPFGTVDEGAGLNVLLTSSLPAAKSANGKNNRY